MVADLIPPLSNKQPKIIAANLLALTAIYHAYGVKIVDPKPVLKALTKLFGHADKNVRAEASNLVVELYRWLREGMKPLFWDDLKPVQQQDLEKLFEKVKQEQSPTQERLLRSQQAKAAAPAEPDAIDADEDVVEESVGVDAFDLAEPVNVYNQIPADFHENIASKKWSDRKEALDAFFAIANVPRIKDGPFDEAITAFAKCMKDANVGVVAVAANCVEALAKGLRRSFAKYRSRIMSPMLERLKEKKQAVADALGAALDAVFASTNLSECLEEILEFLKNKNPQVKLETLRFLIRCLKTTRDAPSKAETKLIADAAIKLLTESTEVMRSGGAEILGTLMKIMGERQMTQYLEGLDDIRKTKIKEYFDAAVVKAKDKPKPVAAPPKAAPAPQKKVVGKRPTAGVKKPAPTARASTPQAEEPVPDAKPAVPRTLPSKLGGLPRSGLTAPSGGLKLQKRVIGPGAASVSAFASPKRNIPSPDVDDETPTPVPKIGLGGRGLAGRPLGKPVLTPSDASTSSTAPGMTPAERAELDDLRAEKDRLQRLVDDIRLEKSKLTSQINELQHQNAQLIEDHTRDVLSIKAKETQLVRARSDAEAAQQTVARQTRDLDRMKRELGRTVRAASPTSYVDGSGSDGIYRDTASSSNSTVNTNSSSGLDRYNSSNVESREVGYQRAARAYMTSPSEEKENGGLEAGERKTNPAAGMNGNSREESPGREREREGQGQANANANANGNGNGNGNGNAGVNGEPIESWKRAAEVTSQLKARIEQMKVCVFSPLPLSFFFIFAKADEGGYGG